MDGPSRTHDPGCSDDGVAPDAAHSCASNGRPPNDQVNNDVTKWGQFCPQHRARNRIFLVMVSKPVPVNQQPDQPIMNIFSKTIVRNQLLQSPIMPFVMLCKALNIKTVVFSLLAFILFGEPSFAQSQTGQRAQSPHPSAALDAAEIRRRAAELNQIRALLNDPDPDVRLMAMRSIASSDNVEHRQLALDFGLSSSESVIQDLALRILFRHIQSVILPFTEERQISSQSENQSGPTQMNFIISSYDFGSGRVEGFFRSFCIVSPDNKLVGQIVGHQFTVQSANGACAANLRWDSSARQFVGFATYPERGNIVKRNVIWKPM